MRIRRPFVPLALLALTVLGASAVGVPSSVLARTASDRVVPSRFIISNPNLSDVLPPSVQIADSRFRSSPGPRYISGSFIKQNFEVYGNSANTALPVNIYTVGDLRAGVSPGDLRKFDQPPPAQSTRLKAPRYILDLRRVRPENRMPLLTRILGPERARQAMNEARAAGRY